MVKARLLPLFREYEGSLTVIPFGCLPDWSDPDSIDLDDFLFGMVPTIIGMGELIEPSLSDAI